MRLCLELRAAPEAESSLVALQLARSLTAAPAQVKLWKIFFVGEAVLHADTAHASALWRDWQQCALQTESELLVCSASAGHYDLLADSPTGSGRLCSAFVPCGLAELACLPPDIRLLSFNA